MNVAYLSALSALAGSAIGAFATFATTWLTQRYQGEMQRRVQESGRREKLFGDFIDHASVLLADALTHSLDDPSKLVPLYAVMAKLRLFASSKTIGAADAAMRRIVQIYYSPNTNFQDQVSVQSGHFDVLRDFTDCSRAELRDVL